MRILPLIERPGPISRYRGSRELASRRLCGYTLSSFPSFLVCTSIRLSIDGGPYAKTGIMTACPLSLVNEYENLNVVLSTQFTDKSLSTRELFWAKQGMASTVTR